MYTDINIKYHRTFMVCESKCFLVHVHTVSLKMSCDSNNPTWKSSYYCCCFARYPNVPSCSSCCKWWPSFEGPVLQWISKDWESSSCTPFGTILVSIWFTWDPGSQQRVDIIKTAFRFYINCESKLNIILLFLMHKMQHLCEHLCIKFPGTLPTDQPRGWEQVCPVIQPGSP